MANPNKYYSRWTGKQVDDAVGNAANAVTKDAIVQTQGNNPDKVMSQAAVSTALSSVPSAQDITNAVNAHNGDASAHPYLQGLINAKPNVTNSRSDSQTDTYSANYVNQNFAPRTFVSNLYATKVTSTTATLETARPSVDAGNVLTATTSNTAFDWTTPIFSFTRELENEVTLDNENSFTADIYFTLDKNTGMSWGAIISVSTDNGSTWQPISTQQSFGEMAYTANTLTYESLQIFTNALTGTEQYPIGTLLKIDLFTKFDTAHTVTNTICCGVTVDNASVYSYVQFNFTNVSIDTNQINDGAVTIEKLSADLQAEINDIANKANKSIVSTITLDSANWQTSPSNVYSYSYTLTNVLTYVRVSRWQSNDSADLQDVLDNNDALDSANIYNIAQSGNVLTFYAESLPTTDILLEVEVFD
jgi:hypothetical protein